MIKRMNLCCSQLLPSPMWGVVILAIASSVLVPFARDMIYVPMLEVTGELKLAGDMWFAGLFSVYAMALALGHLLWGWLSHRLNHLTVFRLGMVVLFLSSILIFQVTNIYQLLALRFAHGLGVSCQMIMARVLIFHTDYDCTKLAQAFSLSKGIVLFMATLSPIVVSWVAVQLSWQSSCLLVAFMAIAFWGLSFHWNSGSDTPASVAESSADNSATGQKLSLRLLIVDWFLVFARLWKNDNYRNYTLIGLLGFVLIGAFFTASNLIFLKILAMDTQTYSIILAVHMLAAAVGVSLNSFLVHRYAIKKVLACNLVIVTTVYGLWLAQLAIWPLELLSSAGFMFVVSFFTSCITANAMALAVHNVSRKLSGQMFAQLGILNYGVVSIMSTITGLLITLDIILFVAVMFLLCAGFTGFLYRCIA